MAMTEPQDESAGNGRRLTTGEFRAVHDVSASTAQFRAFAEDKPDAGAWNGAAPERSPARIAILVAAVIVVLAIIAILAATLG
jgi:hypothetical protein